MGGPRHRKTENLSVYPASGAKLVPALPSSSFRQSVRVDLLARSMLQSVGESTACRETSCARRQGPRRRREMSVHACGCRSWFELQVLRTTLTNKVSVLDLFGIKNLSLSTLGSGGSAGAAARTHQHSAGRANPPRVGTRTLRILGT